MTNNESMMEYDGSRGYGSSGDRADLLESVLVISAFLRKRGMVLTAETQEELLVALDDSTPQPNTRQEWADFGQYWLSGGWEDMQWYDTTEGAVDDAGWFDFTDEDCFYPYDEHLVIRFKK